MTVPGRKDLKAEPWTPSIEPVILRAPVLQTQMVQTPKNFEIPCTALGQISPYKYQDDIANIILQVPDPGLVLH